MAAVADHKGIPLAHLSATVEGRTEFEGLAASTHFLSRLDLPDTLGPRERRILFNAARQCEVHKMLRGKVTFEERLSLASAAEPR